MDASPPLHPTDGMLLAYGLGKLGDPDASAVDLHLEACALCRQRVSELSGDSFVGRLRDAGSRPRASAPPAAPGPTPSSGPKVPPPDPALAGTLPPELMSHPRYQVIRELGRGGMGVVYLAWNRLMERMEVLKVLNKEMLARKGTYDRFLREIRAAARLSHPNVVTAYSADEWGDLLVFAMEYIDGEDLALYVKSRGPRPLLQACSMIYQAALGLQHAHEKGMVHRDIKPANLMLAYQGRRATVKLLDFGLAKATSENPFEGSLTREGQMLGTVDYIAPEQAVDAQSADIRADIYSLGCTLYYLLAGGPPFQGTSLAGVVLAHQSVDAKPLNLVRPEVPVELAAVVAKMMAKDPRRRYQTPEEVAEALKPFCKPRTRTAAGAAQGPSTGVDQPGGNAVATEVAPAVPTTTAPKDTTASTPQPEVTWEGLIAIPEPEGLTEAKPRSATSWPGRPGPLWARVRLVAGALLALVIAFAAGALLFGPPKPRPDPGPVPPPKRDGFVALFNGKDTTGWKTHPSQRGDWRVENGILIGSGPRANGRISHLYTDRGDFRDFHLRIEARVNYDGNSGVYFRSSYGPAVPAESPWFPLGYQARIKIKHGISDYTGTLFTANGGPLGNRRESPVSPFQFFTLEVIARANHIVIKVNGETTADYIDARWRHESGHIALQQLESGTLIEFRKIEIKELPESSGPPKSITNSIGMQLVLIPAGEFLMGSPDTDKEARNDEKPQHRVRITRPFYLGVTEVTQGQYKAITGKNPSHFQGPDDRPVEQVSWLDAVDFCNALSSAERLTPYYWVDGRVVHVTDWTASGYRLPTEAEWEYACRAGRTTRFSFGDDAAQLGMFAWYEGHSGAATNKVGLNPGNWFGLFDMHGNVREWCWDGYDATYYARSPIDEPRALAVAEAALRLHRGGSWNDDAVRCRAADRNGNTPQYRSNTLGFRVARVQSGR